MAAAVPLGKTEMDAEERRVLEGIADAVIKGRGSATVNIPLRIPDINRKLGIVLRDNGFKGTVNIPPTGRGSTFKVIVRGFKRTTKDNTPKAQPISVQQKTIPKQIETPKPVEVKIPEFVFTAVRGSDLFQLARAEESLRIILNSKGASGETREQATVQLSNVRGKMEEIRERALAAKNKRSAKPEPDHQLISVGTGLKFEEVPSLLEGGTAPPVSSGKKPVQSLVGKKGPKEGLGKEREFLRIIGEQGMSIEDLLAQHSEEIENQSRLINSINAATKPLREIKEEYSGMSDSAQSKIVKEQIKMVEADLETKLKSLLAEEERLRTLVSEKTILGKLARLKRPRLIAGLPPELLNKLHHRDISNLISQGETNRLLILRQEEATKLHELSKLKLGRRRKR